MLEESVQERQRLRPARLTFTVKEQGYATGVRHAAVAANSQTTLSLPTATPGGWYDLVITTAEDPSFQRRLTGHLENGTLSVTG